MKKNTKIILFILFIPFLIVIFARTKNDLNPISYNSDNLEVENTSNTSNVSPDYNTENLINIFVDDFNMKSSNKIIDLKDFDVNDKNSGYYRTEFRLAAFENAIGKVGSISGNAVVFVNYSSKNFQTKNFRIYATVNDKTLIKEILKYSVEILDKSVSNQDIENIFTYIDTGNFKNFVLGENDSITGYIDNSTIMIDFSEKI